MARTTTTPTGEATLDVLARHQPATTAELARAAGIGKSTAARFLAGLEREGRVVRQPGGRVDGRREPDRWSQPPRAGEPTTGTASPEGHRPAAPAAEHATTTALPPSDDADDVAPTGVAAAAPPADPRGGQGGPDTHPSAGEAAPGPGAPPTASVRVSAGTDGAARQRLRAGALRELVRAYLAARPGRELTPTAIGNALGRSSGAVGNALATLVGQGAATQTSSKPRRYTVAAEQVPAASG